MRRLLFLMPIVCAGCQACHIAISGHVEANVTAVAQARSTPGAVPCAAPLAGASCLCQRDLTQARSASEAAVPAPPGPLDLPALWNLAVANNPALREAAAEVETARGQLIQSSKYPNPRFVYTQDELGTKGAPAGAVAIQANQEVVTAGKRRLDVAIATRGTDAASVALLGRKFEVLTRIRRAYYDYLGWQHMVQVHAEVVAALQQGAAITRIQVEEVKTRPRADLLRLQALLEEAKITQSRSRVNLEAAWRQLAAEVGVPQLPMPRVAEDWAEPVPQWDVDAVVERVLAANTELKQAAVEAERARLEVERARAEAVPNVTVGGGYTWNFFENARGALISVETALPVWDRKQGRLHEAQARWARAQAAQRTAAARLSRDTAEAFARYQAARQQVERLTTEVLPRLVESLELVRKSYQGGSAQVTFADVLLTEETLSDTRIRRAEARRDLWRAIADLQGLMQLDVGEELAMAAQEPR